MLQPISSKIEMLAMTDVECIYYQFNQPELFVISGIIVS